MERERRIVAILRRIAEEEGIDFQSLSYDWIIRLCRGGVVRWVFGYDFDLNPCCAQLLAKDKAGAAMALALAGIARVEHILFCHPQDKSFVPSSGTWTAIMAYAEQYRFNVVCKPNDCSGGRDVTHARSLAALEEAVQKLFGRFRAIALSPFLDITNEYRIIVLKSRCLIMYRKVRPMLMGDGSASRLELLCRSADRVKLFETLSEITACETDLSMVVPEGEGWQVGWKHNLGLGAHVELVPESCPQRAALEKLAAGAATALNLEFGSVDIVETRAEGSLAVLEVNAGVMMESFVDKVPQGEAIATEIYRAAVNAMFV